MLLATGQITIDKRLWESAFKVLEITEDSSYGKNPVKN